jgi:CBS domain-containing protein
VFSAAAAFGLLVLAEAAPEAGVGHALLVHLAALNATLAAVNLLPAFPLDAGRAGRAVAWALRDDFGWATGAAARLGGLTGLAFVALGVLVILGDSAPVAGIAILLFGFTLRTAAIHSHRHLVARSSIAGQPVSRFMDHHPITVQRALSITSLAEDFIYKHQLSMLPVVDGDRLLGYVTAQRVRALPRDEWSRQTIGTIILPFSSENTVTPDTDAVEALDKMTSTGSTRLMVVDGSRLAGVVALNDLARSLHPRPVAQGGPA